MGLIPFVDRNDSLIELLAEGYWKILHPFRVLAPSTAPLSTLAIELRGWPVIVLSNNDGCAIVRTAEAKALGIKMGDPWHLLAKKNRHVSGRGSRPTIVDRKYELAPHGRMLLQRQRFISAPMGSGMRRHQLPS